MSKRYSYKADEIGVRIDRFLKARLRDLSRSYIQGLIRQGCVLVEGKKASPHHRLRLADRIIIELPAQENEPCPEEMPLSVVFEDAAISIIDKPPGLIVHPASRVRSGTLVNGLLYRYGRGGLSMLGGGERPGIVHRLDKDTSGLMVIAKTDNAYRSLTGQFKARQVKRVYLTLVKGKMSTPEGEISLPLGKYFHKKKSVRVKFIEGKDAFTSYKTIVELDGATLLELSPQSGRTHQIRVHMSSIGHPILGDVRYGVKAGLARQALHAWKLGFSHPANGNYLEFMSPFPDDLKEASLGLSSAHLQGDINRLLVQL